MAKTKRVIIITMRNPNGDIEFRERFNTLEGAWTFIKCDDGPLSVEPKSFEEFKVFVADSNIEGLTVVRKRVPITEGE